MQSWRRLCSRWERCLEYGCESSRTLAVGPDSRVYFSAKHFKIVYKSHCRVRSSAACPLKISLEKLPYAATENGKKTDYTYIQNESELRSSTS